VGATESRLQKARFLGDRMADIAGWIGYNGLKVSSGAFVICSVLLGVGSTARECLTHATRAAVLLGADLLILTILGWGVHSWAMILVFPGLSFAVSAVMFLIIAAVHAVLDRRRRDRSTAAGRW
jgi:hypothetical protein